MVIAVKFNAMFTSSQMMMLRARCQWWWCEKLLLTLELVHGAEPPLELDDAVSSHVSISKLASRHQIRLRLATTRRACFFAT